MLVKGIGNMISGIDHLKNSVAKITGAVVHGDGHMFDQVVFAVIITEIFHTVKPEVLSAVLIGSLLTYVKGEDSIRGVFSPYGEYYSIQMRFLSMKKGWVRKSLDFFLGIWYAYNVDNFLERRSNEIFR